MLIITHGFWDDIFKVDNISIFLLIILILSPYVSLVKKIKIGDYFEAEITSEEVNDLERQVDNIPKNEAEIIKSKTADQLADLAETDSDLALAKARIEIEKKIRSLAEIYLKPQVRFSGLKGTIHELKKMEIINPSLGALLDDVVTVANRAIHGEDISKKNIVKLIDIAIQVIQELDYVIIKHALKSERIEVVPQSEVEDYRNAKYILKTIIPYTKKPEKRTYILNQDELEAFLEGYSEYVEFIISLEKEK